MKAEKNKGDMSKKTDKKIRDFLKEIEKGNGTKGLGKPILQKRSYYSDYYFLSLENQEIEYLSLKLNLQ